MNYLKTNFLHTLAFLLQAKKKKEKKEKKKKKKKWNIF